MSARGPPAPPASSGGLLSLDEVEERVLHLMGLCATVCAALSEVHPDSVAEVTEATRDFHATLRLVHASLLAHIRAHAGEVNLGAVGAVGGAHASSSSASGLAASGAREYRRNVYLDAQHATVLLESLEVVKERIEHAQAAQQQLQEQRGQQTAVKVENT